MKAMDMAVDVTGNWTDCRIDDMPALLGRARGSISMRVRREPGVFRCSTALSDAAPRLSLRAGPLPPTVCRVQATMSGGEVKEIDTHRSGDSAWAWLDGLPTGGFEATLRW